MKYLLAGRQKCMHDFFLSRRVLVKVGLEAVENGTPEGKGLLLVDHRHQKQDQGLPRWGWGCFDTRKHHLLIKIKYSNMMFLIYSNNYRTIISVWVWIFRLTWFFWFPRIISDSVLIVSVRISAGIPLAIRMSQNLVKSPQDWIVFWQLIVTWQIEIRLGQEINGWNQEL